MSLEYLVPYKGLKKARKEETEIFGEIVGNLINSHIFTDSDISRLDNARKRTTRLAVYNSAAHIVATGLALTLYSLARPYWESLVEKIFH
ncbi:MAG: hypothetical protein AABW51_03145 [Nanoarchaeota archaeon]